ncbi:ROK family protein [Acidicapsa dinghuensis]|uniref:ROK family protein n=1 Tax=Acidicapsa dinghuensis TaxID=2218256 RepID=A0ABW1ENE4_9BACT|nr:ROK family protein [Acidicapsa dinghuensis]
MLALSLDMGGTHIACAVVDDEHIRASRTISSAGAASLEALLPQMEQTLRTLLQEANANASSCIGMSMGFPGIIDIRSGRIISTLKKYEDAKELNLDAWCRDAFGIPLRIENDARMALLGEKHAGAARGIDDVVMMTLGTGIGGAAMMQGRLLRGAHSQGGCLGGHFTVNWRGRKCACGNIGCAEAEASGWSLPQIIREDEGFEESSLSQAEILDFRMLFEEAQRGDALAIATRQRCLEVWAANAVSLVHAYDPEVIVMGGGVMQSGDVIVPYVQKHVQSYAWTTWGTPKVCAAELGTDAALLGAIPLLNEDLV